MARRLFTGSPDMAGDSTLDLAAKAASSKWLNQAGKCFKVYGESGFGRVCSRYGKKAHFCVAQTDKGSALSVIALLETEHFCHTMRQILILRRP
jgi:hypothetical protein